MKKRNIITVIAAFLTLAVLLPASVIAELPVPVRSGEWDYLNDDGESATICRYYGSAKEVAIPGEIDGLRVKRLGSWYQDLGMDSGVSHGIFDAAPTEKVTIPDSVTAIDGAFYGCASLKSVTIPDSVTEIGSGSFERCSSLTDVVFPDSVTQVGCDVLGDSAFFKDASNWEDGVLYCGRHLISVSNDIKGAYIIKPGTLTIADWAFSSCKSLESVEIPDSIKEISFRAFGNCYALKSVKLPKYLEKIGPEAFTSCESLGNVTFPDTLKEIGAFAFRYCPLIDDVKLPDGLESIGNNVFDETAFYENEANWDEDGNLYIGKYLIELRGDVGENYTVKPGTRCIAEFAFYSGVSIKELTLPEGLTHISACAFVKCLQLNTVYFPGTLQKIGFHAFNRCDMLKTVNYAGTKEQWESVGIDEGNDPILNANVVFKYADPARLLAYRDAEHTQPIEGDFTPGEKVYYAIECAPGYFATKLRIDNTSYIDGECFIPGEGALDIKFTYYLAGDIKSDGKVNSQDVRVLLKWLVNDTPTFWENYGSIYLDFNRDGKTNSKDVIALMKQIVGGKSIHGGVQENITGVRAATALGDALFGAGAKWNYSYDGFAYHWLGTIPAEKPYEGKECGYYTVIKDKAELEALFDGVAEPTDGEKEFMASPAEYLASVTDDTFADRTLVYVSLGSNEGAISFDGADFVNGTLVPRISVYGGYPGFGCDPYTEHFMIIAFDKLPDGQPISPQINLNYPM